MFLSLLMVNAKLESGSMLLNDAYSIHQRLYKGLTQDANGHIPRPLYRVDFDHAVNDVVPMHVLTEDMPDWSKAFRRVSGILVAPPVVRPFVVPNLATDDLFRFRVRLNPVIRGWKGIHQSRIRKNDLVSWFMWKAQQYGFEALECRAVDIRVIGGNKARNKLCEYTAIFEGVARTLVAERLSHALTHGIGRGKTLGCGLLSFTKEP